MTCFLGSLPMLVIHHIIMEIVNLKCPLGWTSSRDCSKGRIGHLMFIICLDSPGLISEIARDPGVCMYIHIHIYLANI